MNTKRILVGLVMGLLAFVFATAGVFGDNTPDKFATIGVIHPYFFPMEGAVKDYAANTGSKVIYQATKDFDMEQENTIIDGLTPQGYNGFALWPGHPYSVNTTITALNKQGNSRHPDCRAGETSHRREALHRDGRRGVRRGGRAAGHKGDGRQGQLCRYPGDAVRSEHPHQEGCNREGHF